MIFLAILASHCTPANPTHSSTTTSELLGDLKPVVSVKELMRDQIDPLADNIFAAVGTSVTTEGVTEIAPRTDDDWAKVRIGAVVLAEAANLLKIPRPFAPPGDVNDSVGPNAPELSPDAIKAKVDADKPLWNTSAEKLRTVAIEVLEIVERKDTNALFDAARRLDRACENCHLEYWYPGDRKILERLRKEVENR